MKSPYVSIIIPIYKVEPYLERCLKSIKAQTFADFEAILVDDGSPDNCGAICDAFAGGDSRFLALHQPNARGQARNNGLERASGQFITFADPDDYVGPDYLKHMIDAQKRHDADLVIARYVSLNERTMLKAWQVPATKEVFIRREDFGEALPELYNHSRIGTLYSKLYKREILKGHKYSETVKMRGDVMFVTQLLERTQSIEIINDSDYFYIRYAAGSITKQVDPDLFETHIEINHAMEETMARCGWMKRACATPSTSASSSRPSCAPTPSAGGPGALRRRESMWSGSWRTPSSGTHRAPQGAISPSEIELMRPGNGAEWIRRLDAAVGRRRPLAKLIRR